MKKSIWATLCLIGILGVHSNSFALTKLYETSRTQVINSGTNLTKYQRLTDKGWLSMNVIDVDLTDENTRIGVLTSANGLHTFQNVKTMLSNAKNGIAAINADFFTGNYQKGNMIGMTIREGQLLTSTYEENATKDTLASFVLTKNGEAFLDYFSNQITIKDLKNDETFSVAEMNKWSSNYDYPVLYTREWGESSIDLEGITELVVNKGKVVEVRNNEEPTAIPENGFVVSASRSGSRTDESYFSKGT